MQDDYVSTEHLLLGLSALDKPATFKQFLKNFELSPKKLKRLSSKLGVGKKCPPKLPKIPFRHLKSTELIWLNKPSRASLTR